MAQELDILVPVHGKLDFTMRCITSIYNGTAAPFHLIILDDTEASLKYGSYHRIDPNDVAHLWLRKLAKTYNNITYIEMPRPFVNGNEFFELGFQHCKTDCVATVMNSVTVEPGWETIPLKLMHDDPKIGVIGFKNIFPNGTIESAGIFFNNYTPCDYARDAPGHRINEVSEVQAAQWAFAMVRRSACQGNLDMTSYHGFVGWDDIDNCFEVKKRGWKILYCGQSVGYHQPRATRGSNEIEAGVLNRENSHVFYKKWGLWDKYLEDTTKMDVSNRLTVDLKKVISSAVLEAQVLNKVLEEKKDVLGELSKKALTELNVSPDDYLLEVNPLAGVWNLKPKKLPAAPEGQPKLVQSQEMKPVEMPSGDTKVKVEVKA